MELTTDSICKRVFHNEIVEFARLSDLSISIQAHHNISMPDKEKIITGEINMLYAGARALYNNIIDAKIPENISSTDSLKCGIFGNTMLRLTKELVNDSAIQEIIGVYIKEDTEKYHI